MLSEELMNVSFMLSAASVGTATCSGSQKQAKLFNFHMQNQQKAIK